MDRTRFSLAARLLLVLTIMLPALSLSAQVFQEKDAGGTLVKVATPPTRVVSLTLYSDEVLATLLDPSRIAALSVYSHDPHLSNLAPGTMSGKPQAELNVEFILGLDPDLVLVADWSDSAKVALLRKAGLTVFALPTPTSLNEMKSGLALLGRLCHARQKAGEMISDIDRRLANVDAKLPKAASRKKIVALDYNSWGSANGKGSSWDDMLNRAGLVNGAASWPAGQFAQVSISREMIITLNPDLVFVPDWVYGNAKDASDFLESVSKDPLLAHLRAWKSGGIKVMPERLKSTVSQYMVDAVEFLAAIAWPDRFTAGAAR